MKFEVTDLIIKIISAFLGTIGFSLYFNIKNSRLVTVALGGLLTTCIYFFAVILDFDAFMSSFIASMSAGIYAEILSRLVKAPVTVHLLPAIIPLVPGGSLYYTMSCIVSQNNELFAVYGSETVYTALGLAVGIIFVSVTVKQLRHFKQ